VVSETSTTPQCKLTTTGTEYGVSDLFDLTKMEPYNLEILYKSFTKYSNEVVLYLPRNSDLNQIARYGQDGKKLEVAHYAIMGASKVRYIPCGLSKTLLT
jgi:hypothetical protein